MHKNVESSVVESEELIAYKTKLGVIMFIIYAIVYGGFVAINTINPKLMGLELWGLNLAILYGFFLIIFALILALIYNYLCLKAEEIK